MAELVSEGKVPQLGLSDEHLGQLDELFPPGAAAGDRYPSAGMQSVEL